ncbi:MAG: adventurous gliding motility lipoprotein CglB [Myxococcaceae bacterium]|nr:adventurous gliding motility lipoprotein CglB [Myxococcaceae bacterium]
MKATLLTSLFTLLLSCGRTTLPCEASTCSGCCDGYGNCQPGDVDLECGAGARACVICAKGASCRQGLCLGGTAAGAGGGATAGGATGGGSAGGAPSGGGGAGPMSIGAKTYVPDALLVVDRSGSMAQPVNPNDPACRNCMVNCPPGCLTRGLSMRNALERLLSTTPTPARFGLVLYPTNATCGPPTVASPPVPMSDEHSVLAMMASATITQLRSASFAGGTPTGPALRFAATLPELSIDARREHFMVLATDGLPNCNPMNPATCANPQACRCTIQSCVGQNCTIGCLDRQNTLDALTEASARDVRTLVIAFSSDVTGNTAAVALFDELASAGGAPLSCSSRSGDECGANNPCLGDGTCTRKFSSVVEAGAARVAEVLRRSALCRWVLDQPVARSPKLRVQVNGLSVAPGPMGFEADADDVVRFSGASCAQLVQAGVAVPVAFSLEP